MCQVAEPQWRAVDNEKVACAAHNARRDVSYSGYSGGSAFGSRGIEVRSFLWVEMGLSYRDGGRFLRPFGPRSENAVEPSCLRIDPPADLSP
jgi:hypothetical protein